MGGRFGESAESTDLVVNLMASHSSIEKNKGISYWHEECGYSRCCFCRRFLWLQAHNASDLVPVNVKGCVLNLSVSEMLNTKCLACCCCLHI